MSQSGHGHQKHAGPYWRRAHRDWRFYVAVVLMVAAMLIYGLHYNLVSWSQNKQERGISAADGR